MTFAYFTAVNHNNYYSDNRLKAKIQKLAKWIEIHQSQCNKPNVFVFVEVCCTLVGNLGINVTGGGGGGGGSDVFFWV